MTASKTPRRQEMAYEKVMSSITAAEVASRRLRKLDVKTRDHVLRTASTLLRHRAGEVLEANAVDLRLATELGYTDGQMDRLRLSEQRIGVLADELDRVADLPDPLGVVPGGSTRGPLHVTRVPIGVVGAVYEAQPSVVVEAAAPALKAGNAILLRGALASGSSDGALVRLLGEALEDSGLPADAVQLLPVKERSSTRHLVCARSIVGMVLLRGGAGMVRGVVSEATVPLVDMGAGICHVYVDANADLELATRIVLDSKVNPTLPHAVQTVLVHIDVADRFVPTLLAALAGAHITAHGDLRVAGLVRDVVAATETDWLTEYLSRDIAIGLVDTLDDALGHIRQFGTKHTEVVVTRDRAVADAFVDQVDAASVRLNSPTVGASDPGGWDSGPLFSTQKLHARGPIEPSAFTTSKWVTWRM